ncbi:MAG: hypothetical protein ACKOPS_10415 [Cyanobium sp.]
MYGAAAGAFATADLAAISLEAFKGYTVPAGEVGLAGIVTRTTPALLQLQQAIVLPWPRSRCPPARSRRSRPTMATPPSTRL